jgi:hypothetical protein
LKNADIFVREIRFVNKKNNSCKFVQFVVENRPMLLLKPMRVHHCLPQRFFAVLVVFLLSVITVFAGSKLNDLNIHAVLDNNGDARITETRLMHVTSEGTECYTVLQNLKGQTISDLEVSDESGMSFNNIGEWDVNRSRSAKTGKCGIVTKSNGYDNFVNVQSDAALRKVAGLYAYDNIDHHSEELTLRSGGEEINNRLEEELRSRLNIAGIEVVEARINYLAYAAEIASVMLRRQQAEAIISAREKIVDGAVSMVDLALKKLSKEHIVELDEERKAAMVSNLLVVLCADESASPVINTGTLYN